MNMLGVLRTSIRLALVVLLTLGTLHLANRIKSVSAAQLSRAESALLAWRPGQPVPEPPR